MDAETNADRRRELRSPRARRMGRLLMGCATLALAPAAAQAQSAAQGGEAEAGGEVYRLSPILVDSAAWGDADAESVVAHELWVGGKVATSLLDTPASVSVVTQEEIAQRDAQTVEEVLSYTPGIVTDYYGSDDRNDYFNVRGFDASTYRDGMTLGTMRGVREEPYAFERVEILRGANSTLFGPSSPGGSINYVTKVPRFERFGEAYVEGGSFEHREVGVDFGDVIDEAGTLAFRITAKRKDAEREYDHSRDDETFVLGGLTWEPTPATSLSLTADWLDREASPNSGGYPLDREYDRDEFFGEPGFNYHDVERATVSAQLRHDFGSGLSLRSNIRYSDLNDDYGYVYISDQPGRTGTEVDRFGFGRDSSAEELIGNAMLQYDASFGRIDSSTLAGFEYRDASTTSSSFYGGADPIDVANPVYSGPPASVPVYQEEDQDFVTTSLFLQQNLSFYDTIVATAGLRHDWLDLSSEGWNSGGSFDVEDDFSEFSFRGALTWKVTDEVSTYGSYVESVSPPSIGVEPERGQQYELGVKYSPSWMNALFSASVFELTKDNITVAVVQADGSIDRQLIGETRSRGFELEGKAEITERLSVVAGYSYLDTEIIKSDPVRGVDVEGNDFATTPNHMASIWADYTLPGSGPRGDLTFGAGARFIGSYYFNQQNSGESDAAVVFDAALGYAVTENVDVSVNIDNVFDEQHVVGSGTADYYNPGRAISAKLRYAW